MKELTVKIGDFITTFHCEDDQYIPFLHENFVLQTDSHQQSDLILTISDPYGVPFTDYEVEVTTTTQHIHYKRADYLIKVDHQFKHAEIKVYDELALKHGLMNLFSAFLLYHQWGLLVHSSCVIDNGAAHLFTGHSGAGKSTVALLSQPRSLLSDEATLMKITKEGVLIYDSPFRSELKPDGLTQFYPLKSIQLLKQAVKNERQPLRSTEALFQLIDKVFYWPYEKEETKRIIQQLTSLVQQVPVYELYFQKNNTFWELIS